MHFKKGYRTMENNKHIRLSVVIVNYKTPSLVIEAIKSLYSDINIQTDRVVVVDNLSNDNSPIKITQAIKDHGWGEWVFFVQANCNGGFSYGNNIGIKACKADFYLLLNSDAYIRPGAIDEMLHSFNSDSSIGLVGPRIEWSGGKPQVSCFNNMTIGSEFLSGVQTGLFTRLLAKFNINEVAIPYSDKCKQLDWLSFACIMIKDQVFETTGLLDEGYFMYREDNDFCRRAFAKNWKIVFNSNAKVVHLNQGLSGKSDVRKPRFYFESRARYFKKFYGFFGFLCANFLWTIGRTILFIRQCLSKKSSQSNKNIIIDIWKGTFK
jgi:hypothetical protein